MKHLIKNSTEFAPQKLIWVASTLLVVLSLCPFVLQAGDNAAPTPNAATWKTNPHAIGPYGIKMSATTGFDRDGVEYQFVETSGNPGGTSSDWIPYPTYTDLELKPETEYSYKLQMRDRSGNLGRFSTVMKVRTPSDDGVRRSGPPNVVIIYADDLGYSDIGFVAKMHSPDSMTRTPRIDRIFEEGIFLSNYVTHHVCSPSRAGLLTGKHYWRVGAGVQTGGELDHTIPNIAKDFQRAGYRTGCFGKWHNSTEPENDGPYVLVDKTQDINPENDVLEWPEGDLFGVGVNDYGFDDWAGYYGGGPDHFNRRGGGGRKEQAWWINGKWTPVNGYTDDIIGVDSAKFVADNHQRPFFLYMPNEAVHGPIDITNTHLEELCNLIDDAYPQLAWKHLKEIESPHTGNKIEEVYEMRTEKGQEFDAYYIERDLGITGFLDLAHYAMLYAMDKAVGEVLDTIAAHGLAENTIVVFSSDNGGTSRANNAPFRGGKHNVYEGGVRVCSAIHWPGKLDAKTAPYSIGDNDYDGLVQYNDWYPTLVDMAGQKLSGKDLDGISVFQHLLARVPARPGYDHAFYTMDQKDATVRTKDWKMIYNESPGVMKKEVYDLAKDPGEATNVAESRPEVTRTLLKMMNEWVTSGEVTSSFLRPIGDSRPKRSHADQAKPSGEVLEIRMEQDRTIKSRHLDKKGVYVHFASPDYPTPSLMNKAMPNDVFQYDIFVSEDSELDVGFFCTPSDGSNPYFSTKRGINRYGKGVAQMKLPKGEWVRVVAGFGDVAINGSGKVFLGFLSEKRGKAHFYIDNVVVRNPLDDGPVRAIGWDDESHSGRIVFVHDGIDYDSIDEARSKTNEFPLREFSTRIIDVSEVK